MRPASPSSEPAESPATASEVLVLGAGLSGLAAAARLAEAGASVVVVDKSRGLGGRCATRRMEGQPVDHGTPFLHGRDPALLALARSVPGGCTEGWPARIEGSGAPCHPDVLASDGFRVAFDDGMTALAKHLGAGLDVRRQTRIVSLQPDGGQLRATAESGEVFVASTVVVALPVEQARSLTASLRDPALAPVHTMLSWFASDPALTLLAGYPLDVPAPDFDLLHPDDASVVQVVVHDSAKRSAPQSRALVFHASPLWSRRYLEAPREDWSAALLEAARGLLGDWAGHPLWTSTHRWRYARVPSGLGLNAPLVTTLQGGATLCLAGEAFDDHGGLEGAWRSGRHAADLLSHPGNTP